VLTRSRVFPEPNRRPWPSRAHLDRRPDVHEASACSPGASAATVSVSNGPSSRR